MPNIKDIAIDITFTMDNGERVRTAIHADGSASGWGASREAIGETVDMREALAQVVYDHMQGSLDDDEQMDEPGGDDIAGLPAIGTDYETSRGRARIEGYRWLDGRAVAFGRAADGSPLIVHGSGE